MKKAATPDAVAVTEEEYDEVSQHTNTDEGYDRQL